MPAGLGNSVFSGQQEYAATGARVGLEAGGDIQNVVFAEVEVRHGDFYVMIALDAVRENAGVDCHSRMGRNQQVSDSSVDSLLKERADGGRLSGGAAEI